MSVYFVIVVVLVVRLYILVKVNETPATERDPVNRKISLYKLEEEQLYNTIYLISYL